MPEEMVSGEGAGGGKMSALESRTCAGDLRPG